MLTEKSGRVKVPENQKTDDKISKGNNETTKFN
jgi:hypothetical protein